MKCKICNCNFETEKAFHSHFRGTHKLKYSDYYSQYHPKYDLWSGDPIPFKNRKQYLEANFLNKRNLINWITKKASLEESKALMTNLLLKRIKEKNLTLAPSQVALRSTGIPAIQYFDKVFGSYESVCSSLGLEVNLYNREISLKEEGDDFTIVIDTREQQELEFDNKTTRTKCAVGDYTAMGDHHCNLFIDRKNPSDFISTMSGGFKRFIREVELANDLDAYLVVLVESPLTKMMNFDYTYLKRFTKATPDYIFNHMRQLLEDYSNIQFLFVKDRDEASKSVKNILLMGESVKNTDLQLCYDNKKLIN